MVKQIVQIHYSYIILTNFGEGVADFLVIKVKGLLRMAWLFDKVKSKVHVPSLTESFL